MSRTARASRGGICYHVMNRGNTKATVFLDAEDYLRFIDLLRRAKERLPTLLLAYCLPNHFHLVVRTSSVPLWRSMRLVQHRYAQGSNRRCTVNGPLWQARYKARPIIGEESLFGVGDSVLDLSKSFSVHPVAKQSLLIR